MPMLEKRKRKAWLSQKKKKKYKWERERKRKRYSLHSDCKLWGTCKSNTDGVDFCLFENEANTEGSNSKDNVLMISRPWDPAMTVVGMILGLPISWANKLPFYLNQVHVGSLSHSKTQIIILITWLYWNIFGSKKSILKLQSVWEVWNVMEGSHESRSCLFKTHKHLQQTQRSSLKAIKELMLRR